MLISKNQILTFIDSISSAAMHEITAVESTVKTKNLMDIQVFLLYIFCCIFSKLL